MTRSISVEHLSKQFQIGQAKNADMLREVLVDLATLSFRKKREPKEVMWALRDLSFNVDEGEVLGIVGRNGAGKSTLLKILSRVTRATSGSVKVNGSVAALLEVGTGFHEELTGKENIYLCGSILGMAKKRIDAKLDEIIDFAGVEKFIETPIKRYSSGMRLRLGFAVAANLEADILFIDEVLAVGDAEFQKKCLQSMSELRSKGRTVLFVSHNLAAVENLCSRAIWIDGGRVRQDGEPHDVIESYLASFARARDGEANLRDIESRRGSGSVRFTQIEFLDGQRRSADIIKSGDKVVIRLFYDVQKRIESPIFGVDIHTQLGTLVTQVHTYNSGFDVAYIAEGSGYVDVEIRELNVMPGHYLVSLYVANLGHIYHDVLQHCAVMDVQASASYGLNRGFSGNPVMCLECKWEMGAQDSTDLRTVREIIREAPTRSD
jgi:lipopolysaccharide transport system ATP-binding protein